MQLSSMQALLCAISIPRNEASRSGAKRALVASSTYDDREAVIVTVAGGAGVVVTVNVCCGGHVLAELVEEDPEEDEVVLDADRDADIAVGELLPEALAEELVDARLLDLRS